MIDGKQRELQELTEEMEIILSVKDDISYEEICNLVNKFSLLSEYDIRKKIEELTGDYTYIQEFVNNVNEETSNVPTKLQKNLNNPVINLEDINDSKSNKYEEDILTKESKENKDINDDFDLDIKRESDKTEETIEKEEIELHNSDFPNEFIQKVEQQDENSIKIIFDEDNIPEVSFVKAEIKYSQLSLEWGWPNGVDKVLLCYRMDKFPVGPTDSCASQVSIRREDDLENGDYIIQKIIEGNYYFSIYTSVEQEGKMLFSNGQRRLVVNKAPSEVFYEIKIRKSLLGKLKTAELVFHTKSKEVNLPQFILVGRLGNMPLQKSDGEAVFITDYQTLTNDEGININLPIEKIGKNMYVKLFFLDDSNSKVYRIISPAKERLYFK
jgi:hypothetical protein